MHALLSSLIALGFEHMFYNTELKKFVVSWATVTITVLA